MDNKELPSKATVRILIQAVSNIPVTLVHHLLDKILMSSSFFFILVFNNFTTAKIILSPIDHCTFVHNKKIRNIIDVFVLKVTTFG